MKKFGLFISIALLTAFVGCDSDDVEDPVVPDVYKRQARAQHTVGVFGGFGTGTARFYPAQETKSVGGRFSGGFSWRYYSATRFVGCVGVELEFLQRGFAYAPFASTTENEADYVYYTRKLNSFVVPLVWQPHFYLARRHLRVSLEAALTFSYNFDSSYVNDVARENGVEPWRGKYEFKTARDNRWGLSLIHI